MNQGMQIVKSFDNEIINSTNALSPQRNRHAHSTCVFGVVVFLLLGLVAHSIKGEINFSVLIFLFRK